MPFVMLIDTREPFDDGHRRSREPWLVTLLDWLLPWPALIVWLCVASRLVDGWAAVGLVWGAVFLAAWRGLKALPADGDGLNQNRQ
jgi:hypothetical protein